MVKPLLSLSLHVQWKSIQIAAMHSKHMIKSLPCRNNTFAARNISMRNGNNSKTGASSTKIHIDHGYYCIKLYKSLLSSDTM